MAAVTRSQTPYSPGPSGSSASTPVSRPGTVFNSYPATTVATKVIRPQIGLIILRPNVHWNPGQN